MKRLLAIILTVLMLIGLVPASAFAASGKWDGSVDISWYDPSASEYYISTPAQLAGLAALVNGMVDPSCPKIIGDKSYIKSIRVDGVMLVGAGGGNVYDTVYTSDIDFAYKTVYLTADLDMGAVYDAKTDSWSGPNWTPIGGKFPMKPDELGDCLTLDTRFNGVLDGQGHSISNLYCDRYAEKGFPYSMAIGIVGFLGGASDNNENITDEFENGWQPAVRNLVLSSGYIYGRRMVGGIVGRTGDASNGVIIENCGNRADVHNTDSKGVGGIVGSAWSDGIIRNCYNTGRISTTYTCPAGGILGTNTGMDVYNCYSVGTIDTNGLKYGRGIGAHDSGIYTVANCYYLSGSDDDSSANGYYKGASKRISVSCTALSDSEMKGSAFVSKLNANGEAFAVSSSGKNNGYPVLWFENGKNTALCQVSVSETLNGSLSLSKEGSLPFGTTIDLESAADGGYLLDYYTVGGKKINGSFWTVTADASFGAVFKKVKTAKLEFNQSDAFYLAVRRTGYKFNDDGSMSYVSEEPVYSGDLLLEGNILTLRTHEYSDAVPADSALEYRSGVIYTVTNTVKNADGSYSVSGSGDVSIKGVRNTQGKSWTAVADTSWYTGKSSVYSISSAEQLAGIAVLTQKGVNFKNITIKLDSDISLKADSSGQQRSWTVIGSSVNNAFSGIFDGQGHKITGLRSVSDKSYSGLFGCCVGAEIKSLVLCGSSENSANVSYAGGLAAYLSASTVHDCSVYVDVNAKGTHAGGIAAYTADGTVIKNCFSYGSISGLSGVGGIAGVVYSGTDSIIGCANFGKISASGVGNYGCGGLFGRLAGAADSCVNYGAVSSGDRYTGGIAGYTTARNKTKITCCANNAAVSSTCSDEKKACGWLAGYAQNLIWSCCENSENSLNIFGTEGNIRDAAVSGDIPKYSAASRPSDVAGGSASASAAAGTSRPATVENSTVTKSGSYYIPWFATGTITIGSGLDVVLYGEYGPFENLKIIVGQNTKLTISNLEISSDDTIMQLAGGNSLVLAGESTFEGTGDNPEGSCPTVAVNGSWNLSGDGSLCISAQVNNCCIAMASGASFKQNDGTLSVFKAGKLGHEGGAFDAAGCSLEFSDANFFGRTDSDNVQVLYAGDIKIDNSYFRVSSEKCPKAVYASAITAYSSRIAAYGHSGNSAAKSVAYYKADAFESIKTQTSVSWENLLTFSDVHAEDLWYDDVLYCCNAGLLKGTSKTEFSPDDTLTRAMFVTAFYRKFGSPAVSASSVFKDLKEDWYTKPVNWAYASGIVNGTSASTFSPYEELSIEQLAAMYARASGESIDAGKDLPDGIGAVSDWAKDSVIWAYEKGIFTLEQLSEPVACASRRLLAQTLHSYCLAGY